MKNIILSIRYENNSSLVSANDNLSSVEFSTSYENIFILLFLVRVKLLKQKMKHLYKRKSIVESEYNM